MWNRDPEATEKMLALAQNLKNRGKKAAVEGNKWREDTVEKRIEHALVKVCFHLVVFFFIYLSVWCFLLTNCLLLNNLNSEIAFPTFF